MKNSIKANRMWSWDSVRAVCVKHNFYTLGTNEAYASMLTFVKTHKPTYRNLYTVACDILEHSDGQSITNIMFLLERYAVITTFTINGQEDV